MKNKKIIALTTSILLLFIFGNILLPMIKATETYTEEIEDFSCVDDTYVYSGWSYMNHGDSPLLTVGYDIQFDLMEQYCTVFKFDLTNRPENHIKTEVVLTFKEHGMNILVPFYLSNNAWNEEELTNDNFPEIEYPPTILPYSTNLHIIYGVGYIEVTYDIDITEYSEFQFISFGLVIAYVSSDFEEDISTIYSKEYPTESVRPKIIWTVEHEIVIPQNNEIMFLFLGLFTGLVGVCATIGVFMVLNKRKSKI